MNVLLLDPTDWLEQAFRRMGHNVLALRFDGGLFHLPGILEGRDFAPELLIQQERLGRRSFFGGLSRFDCPSVFLSIDSHLNMYWQQWYGLLFDVLAGPHLTLFEALPASRRLNAARVSWPGGLRKWRPHAQRRNSLGFCARIDKNRPIRAWMVELLSQVGLVLPDFLSNEEMFDFYDDCRLVPNECIANEVNFRLLEGASCGCLVLTPDIGEDQNVLFTPGKEILVYADGLELLEQAVFFKANISLAEKMARAAFERVRAEHLPEHRVASVIGIAENSGEHRLRGAAASMAFWLAAAMQLRGGKVDLPPRDHAQAGLELAHSLHWPDLPFRERFLAVNVLAQVLCLFAEPAADARAPGPSIERAYLLCRDLLRGAGEAKAVASGQKSAGPAPHPAFHLELAATASAFALREGDFDMARAFWALHVEQKAGAWRLPDSETALCLAWSDAFREGGEIFQSGFPFVAEKGMLPGCALTWLLFGLEHLPQSSPEFFTRCGHLLARRPDLLQLYIGVLAENSLRAENDWRLQMDYGLASLKACRVEQGLSELRRSGVLAGRAGQERLFFKRLGSRPPSGRNWNKLLS